MGKKQQNISSSNSPKFGLPAVILKRPQARKHESLNTTLCNLAMARFEDYDRSIARKRKAKANQDLIGGESFLYLSASLPEVLAEETEKLATWLREPNNTKAVVTSGDFESLCLIFTKYFNLSKENKRWNCSIATALGKIITEKSNVEQRVIPLDVQGLMQQLNSTLVSIEKNPNTFYSQPGSAAKTNTAAIGSISYICN